ncbi:hypothetical protein PR048_020083 [Dryococelus australis]|uniref:Uncharacterized protein n=1 Tax=Dryococelus australis TaxID=614101 RepID=A0ABQ9H5E5_9NEOP|nr:hypothetical protein PR048_020083 [Dryococelus australis]
MEGQVEHVKEFVAIIKSIPKAYTDMCQNDIKNLGTSQNKNYILEKRLLLFQKGKHANKLEVMEKAGKMLMKYFHDYVVGNMGITKT